MRIDSIQIRSVGNLKVDIGDVKFVTQISQTYEGDYRVTPKANEEIVLQTKDKLMRENVTVEKVPFFDVSNDFGTTIYIASEVQ